jgi:carbonic anhydrase
VSVIEELLANNARFAESFDHGDLTSPPALRLAVVTCMDARLDVHRILGIAEGDAHVIRNAGGIVSEDALRSLVISQRLLGTTEVAVIHHSDCGMLKICEEEVKDQIEAETGLRPPFTLGAFTDLEADVRESVARIRANPFIPHRDRVRGFVYDCATGRLGEVRLRKGPAD